jgi:putative hydrolase of the HAD superfamily
MKEINDRSEHYRESSLRSRLKAALVDLDDTIITDSAASAGLWRDICCRFSPLPGNISVDALAESIIRVARLYWSDDENHRRGRLNLAETRRMLVRDSFHRLGTPNDGLADIISDTYTTEKESLIKLAPGAVETLLALKAGGLALALISNGASGVQRRKIERFELEPVFDYILIEGEFGMGKPLAPVFYSALANLDAQPDAAVMIGDDLKRDIAGAQALNIFSIWIDWKKRGLPLDAAAVPDKIIGSLAELSGWLS